MMTSNNNLHDDMATVRNQLYIAESLLLSLTICADVRFEDCEEEGAVLAEQAHAKVKEVIAFADRIARKLDAEAMGRAA